MGAAKLSGRTKKDYRSQHTDTNFINYIRANLYNRK